MRLDACTPVISRVRRSCVQRTSIFGPNHDAVDRDAEDFSGSFAMSDFEAWNEQPACDDNDAVIHEACEADREGCGEGTMLGEVRTCADALALMASLPGLSCASELITGQTIGKACCASCSLPAGKVYHERGTKHVRKPTTPLGP